MTEDLGTLIREVGVNKKRIENSQKDIEILSSYNSGKLNQIKELIEKGESTGDYILDLAYRTHVIDEKAVQRLRDISAALAGKKGQFVLIHYGYSDDSMEPRYAHAVGIMARHKPYVEMYRIGVLVAEQFIWEEPSREVTFAALGGRIELPIDRYAEGMVELFRSNLTETHKGRIFSVDMHSYHRSRKFPSAWQAFAVGAFLNPKIEDWKEHLIIGNEAVKAWMEGKHLKHAYQQAEELLDEHNQDTALLV